MVSGPSFKVSPPRIGLRAQRRCTRLNFPPQTNNQVSKFMYWRPTSLPKLSSQRHGNYFPSAKSYGDQSGLEATQQHLHAPDVGVSNRSFQTGADVFFGKVLDGESDSERKVAGDRFAISQVTEKGAEVENVSQIDPNIAFALKELQKLTIDDALLDLNQKFADAKNDGSKRFVTELARNFYLQIDSRRTKEKQSALDLVRILYSNMNRDETPLVPSSFPKKLIAKMNVLELCQGIFTNTPDKIKITMLVRLGKLSSKSVRSALVKFIIDRAQPMRLRDMAVRALSNHSNPPSRSSLYEVVTSLEMKSEAEAYSRAINRKNAEIAGYVLGSAGADPYNLMADIKNTAINELRMLEARERDLNFILAEAKRLSGK